MQSSSVNGTHQDGYFPEDQSRSNACAKECSDRKCIATRTHLHEEHCRLSVKPHSILLPLLLLPLPLLLLLLLLLLQMLLLLLPPPPPPPPLLPLLLMLLLLLLLLPSQRKNFARRPKRAATLLAPEVAHS